MNRKQKRIAVVGQGVIGLTSASRLLDYGYDVDIFSHQKFEETCSMAAGAYWWPHKAYPQARVAAWAQETFNEYTKFKSMPETGIHFIQHYRFCLDADESLYARHLVEQWQQIDGENYGVSCQQAFLIVLPMIDVPVYMPNLRSSIQSRGVAIHIQKLDSAKQLFPDYALVVNCSGVHARQFSGDSSVFPIRGQSVRISLPEGLSHSTRLYQRHDNFTLVLPRSQDVILGGTSKPGDWNCDPDSADTESIFRRCAELVPQVADCRILGAAVGLRPGRKAVRLEVELLNTTQPVIHNYGHGGSGFTLAWGCANEVARLANTYFAG